MSSSGHPGEPRPSAAGGTDESEPEADHGHPDEPRLEAAAKRLDETLRVLRSRGVTDQRIERLVANARPSAKVPMWKQILRRTTGGFWTPAEAVHPEVGWPCVQLAERLVVAHLTDIERRAILASYSQEAKSKLKEWRKAAAEELIAAIDKTTPQVALVQELMWHVHENSQNQQWKRILFARRIPWLAGTLVVSLVAVGRLAYTGQFEDALGPDAWHRLTQGFVVAALGAVMAVALASRDVPATIPEARWNAVYILVRPLLGGAAAVPALLLLKQGLDDTTYASGAGVLAACFIAGFSERWLVERIDALGR